MTTINPKLKAQVQHLMQRVKQLTRWEIGLGVAAAFTAAAGAVANFLGKSISLDAPLQVVHVPDGLLELFSSAAPDRNAGNQGLALINGNRLDVALANASNVLLVAGAVIVILAVIFFAFRVLFQHDEKEGPSPKSVLTAGCFFGISAIIISIVFGAPKHLTEQTSQVSEKNASPRTAFVSAVSKNDLEAVSKALGQIGQYDTPQGLYVRAQVALMKGDKGKAQLPANAELVAKVLPSAAAFSAEPHALYAIERAAYGEPRSPDMIALRDKTARSQLWHARASSILGGLLTAFLLGLFGTMGLKMVIKRRLNRIDQLLTVGLARGGNP